MMRGMSVHVIACYVLALPNGMIMEVVCRNKAGITIGKRILSILVYGSETMSGVALGTMGFGKS